MKIFLIVLLIFPIAYCSAQSIYSVLNRGEGIITIDGKDNDIPWRRGNVLRDFSFPWRDEPAPNTSFVSLWDSEYLYFIYRVEDRGIFLVNDCGQNEEMCPVGSDRIEIFFRNEDPTKPYYSLEMDAKGRIFDSEGYFGKSGGINKDWDWQQDHISVMASYTEDGYIVEGKFSLESLADLGLLNNGILYAGLYRGEYVEKSGEKPLIKWISWIVPDSSTPNFHIPSSFGILELVK